MTDENEENENMPSFPMFMSFGPTKEQLEKQQMEMVSNAHETRHFFHSLDETQLRKMIGILKMIGFHESPAEVSAYFTGLAGQLLDNKFGVCISCGVKHDEELAKMANNGEEPVYEKQAKSTDPEDVVQLMKQYGVEPDDNGSDKVMCSNCGTWYESLEDRMLRVPGSRGCHGCIQKTKWG